MKKDRKKENWVLFGVDVLLALLIIFLCLNCCGSCRHKPAYDRFARIGDSVEFKDINGNPNYEYPDSIADSSVDSLGMKGDINCMDIVMCIDVTGSMSGILNTVKKQALNFYPDIKRACADLGKNVMGMRIKVIAFRDYTSDHTAMLETPFYNIPDERRRFRSYVKGLYPDGGGDVPESDMEALALAIESDWTHSAGRQRHVILLWTDAPTHPIGAAHGICPNRIPKTFDGLTALWNGSNISQTGKCLIIFAPNDDSWSGIKHKWNNTFFKATSSGGGLSDVGYRQIISTIAESI